MKPHPSVDIRPQVQALLQVLDGDIRHLKQSLVILESLRSLLVKRDETGLSTLLDQVRSRNQLSTHQETQRQTLRQALATTLGCDLNDMTLSFLRTQVSGSLVTAVTEKRHQLQDLVGQLQQQWQLTSRLLQDCARLNRQLFRQIFTQAPSTMYGPGGMQQTLTQANMVNMHI